MFSLVKIFLKDGWMLFGLHPLLPSLSPPLPALSALGAALGA